MHGEETRVLNVLVDSGAQASLVRRGLFAKSLREAQRPLALYTVAGAPMQGGKKSVWIALQFFQKCGNGSIRRRTLNNEFFEAPIGVDLILGYPECKKYKLLIDTAGDGLAYKKNSSTMEPLIPIQRVGQTPPTPEKLRAPPTTAAPSAPVREAHLSHDPPLPPGSLSFDQSCWSVRKMFLHVPQCGDFSDDPLDECEISIVQSQLDLGLAEHVKKISDSVYVECGSVQPLPSEIPDAEKNAELYREIAHHAYLLGLGFEKLHSFLEHHIPALGKSVSVHITSLISLLNSGLDSSVWEHCRKEVSSLQKICAEFVGEGHRKNVSLWLRMADLGEVVRNMDDLFLFQKQDSSPHSSHDSICGVIGVDSPVESVLASKLRQQFLDEFRDTVFRDEIYPPPVDRGPFGVAKIVLRPGVEPIAQRPIHLAGERRQAMIEEVEKWKKLGKVRPARPNTGWSSPGFVIPRSRNRGWRGLVDLRGVNQRIQTDTYPIPLIDSILERQGSMSMWSTLDLRDAFSQIPLSDESMPITTTSTPLESVEWCVVPQGLKNAPAIFQRLMDEVLRPVRDCCDPFFDDIIVGTDVGGLDEEAACLKHAEDLRRALLLLQRHKLVLDFSKASLFARRVEFCGHVLEGGTRRPSPGKLLALERWSFPKTVTEMRAFLGFANYYHAYVRNFAEHAACLMDKLKVPKEDARKGSKKKIEFTAADVEAFENIKKILLSDLKLQIMDPKREFILRVDASDFAVGAVLEQLPPSEILSAESSINRKSYPVAFFSRKLTPSQVRTWSVREKETYSLVMALHKWSSWVGYQKILILTDHKSLENWHSEALDVPSGPVGRRARWHEWLSRFNIEVGYVAGKDNQISDILSRWAYPANSARQDVTMHGSEEDCQAMQEIIRKEKEEERECEILHARAENVASASHPPRDHRVPRSAKKRALVLFSGTGSVDRQLEELGYVVDSLDCDNRGNPSILINIFHWRYKDVPAGSYDVIWASPPCTEFSAALTTRERDVAKGLRFVRRTLNIIRHLQPRFWILENPQSGLLARHSILRNRPHVDLDYCQFAPQWGYRKRTRFWGSWQISTRQNILCDPKTCPCVIQGESGFLRHRQWLGGKGRQPTTWEKYRIPEGIVRYLLLGVKPAEPEVVGNLVSLDSSSDAAPLSAEIRPLPVEKARPKFHSRAQPPQTTNEPQSPLTPSDPEGDSHSQGNSIPQDDEDPFLQDDQEVEESSGSEISDPIEEPAAPDDGDGLGQDWRAAYERCPTWGSSWKAIQDEEDAWPQGFQLVRGKLFLDGRICIPAEFTGQVVMAQHEYGGHLGGERLWNECKRRYAWANVSNAKRIVDRAQGVCELCQATDSPHMSMRVALEHAYVPEQVMSSVALDVFSMPPLVHQGETLDCFVLCVCRTSGWIIAFAAQDAGLTGEIVAKKMLDQWEIFGLPSHVHTDQGSQFVSSWWATLCNAFGIHRTYSQAYHHRSNGRAERAGQLLRVGLRKIHASTGLAWAEALPRAVRWVNDAPGPAGVSPYQLIFGRPRPMGGIPRPPAAGAERAAEFFFRIQQSQCRVSDVLNQIHKERAKRINAVARNPPVYKVGAIVWVLRPRSPFTPKLLSWWIGPCPLVGRVGERSYVVEIKRHTPMMVHAAQLKPFIPNPYRKNHYPLFKFQLSDKVSRGGGLGPELKVEVKAEPEELEWLDEGEWFMPGEEGEWIPEEEAMASALYGSPECAAPSLAPAPPHLLYHQLC